MTTAKKYYKKAIQNGHPYYAYENLVEVLYSEKAYEESVAVAKEGLAIFPYNANLWHTAWLSEKKLQSK